MTSQILIDEELALSAPAGRPAQSAAAPTAKSGRAAWNYDDAFKRNRGLIGPAEQRQLRSARIAIAGMGGVGGVHLATLARLGVGKFTIADPDVFEVANFNRQYGATVSNLGRNKAAAMADAARDINPELDLRVMPTRVDEQNIDEFLRDVDLFVDGLDFFAIDVRRMVFRKAAERGIWAVTAGPMGFSSAVLAFDPAGMSFDRYFDLTDSMDYGAKLASFAVGLAPRATHRGYTDFSGVSIAERTGPSAGIACQLAAGTAAAQTVRILLKRGNVLAAPRFCQLDAYRGVAKNGRLRWGNRGPLQRLKRWLVMRTFRDQFRSLPPARRGSVGIASGRPGEVHP